MTPGSPGRERTGAVKVVINGETFDYEPRRPMSEALAIEHVYKRRYAEWEQDLTAGSARALCVVAWIVWRRDGRDVPFEDIIDGKADFDLGELMDSMSEAAEAEAAEAEPDPTASPDPDGTAGTGTATSPSSPANSTSGRGKSGSSKSGTSKP
jgi:hypothetical protein